MTEIQAVIGRIQLSRMKDWTEKRLANANAIWKVAENLQSITAPQLICDSCDGNCGAKSGCSHGAYKCYIFVDGNEIDRDKIMSRMNERGVPCGSGSCSEVYLEKAFENSPARPKNRLPNAKKLGETSLMFLCHPTLKAEEVQKSCDVLYEVASEYF